ncbi:lipid II flippase MurJ [Streptomyces sp. NPDC088789]|uniref:murein biosynthesis integral membrane protein MurJ n=1 Tax=Streptomyces sp. NPDC088789 TaxID=3365899 RepID=UPI0037FF055E
MTATPRGPGVQGAGETGGAAVDGAGPTARPSPPTTALPAVPPTRTPPPTDTANAPGTENAPGGKGTPGAESTPGGKGTPGAESTPATEKTPATDNIPPGKGTPGTEGTPEAGTTPPTERPPEPRNFLARAALLTGALSVAGALLGLVRDQALARLFGAGAETDAFLVAWTVPEFASTLLIEDGLAFALIPAFSLALARRAGGAAGDPVRALVARTLPRLTLALVAVAAVVVLLAPYLVRALAPGLAAPALAVDCTRLAAVCVIGFGLAGYCSAALRAHRRYLAPAAIYVAYNLGIITAMFLLGGAWGVRSAAIGVAAGSALMVAVQLPALVRRLRAKSEPEAAAGAGAREPAVGLAMVAMILLFALTRQTQVPIERFLASHLPSGAISHLNYAQKVAQIPMTLSLMLVTVTFPVVARALAEGDTVKARDRVERDLALAGCMVLLGTAAVVACAPQIVELLFQRGAFTAEDTAATAAVMRVYALGLLAQTLVGALIRAYCCTGRPTWYPLAAMAVGVVVTAWTGAWAVGSWGVTGIAAANAAGITATAALMLSGTRSHGVLPLRVRAVLAELSRPLRAALVATAAGALAASGPDSPALGLLAGALVVTVVFVLTGAGLGAQGCAPLPGAVRSTSRRLPTSVRSATRRLQHALPHRPRRR